MYVRDTSVMVTDYHTLHLCISEILDEQKLP